MPSRRFDAFKSSQTSDLPPDTSNGTSNRHRSMASNGLLKSFNSFLLLPLLLLLLLLLLLSISFFLNSIIGGFFFSEMWKKRASGIHHMIGSI